MKAECKNCHVKINLPDDKLIPGKDLSFVCPKCKTKNILHVPEDHEHAQAPSTEEAAPAPGEDNGLPDLEEDEVGGVGEFYEEGAKLALVCFDDGPLKDRLVGIIEDKGFQPVFPDSIRDALSRIKLTRFNAILLDEGYEGVRDEQHPIHGALERMNMHTRRHIFFALFGRDFKTLDNMAAFQLSVNMVVNLDDEPKFAQILRKGLAEYDRFYRVFFEISRELGKV